MHARRSTHSNSRWNRPYQMPRAPSVSTWRPRRNRSNAAPSDTTGKATNITTRSRHSSNPSAAQTQMPQHLQDATRDAKALGHGKGYIYPHDYPGHHVAQSYLPEAMAGTQFYEPGDQGQEAVIAERVRKWREALQRRAR